MATFRRSGTTTAAVLSGLVVTLGLTPAIAPESSRRAGVDVWDIGQAARDFRELREESARLGEEAERLRESIEAAEHITTCLIGGELTLAGATELIDPLMRERCGFESAAAIVYAAPTHRLRAARYLIDRVRRSLQSDPSRWASLEARLEGEYREME